MKRLLLLTGWMLVLGVGCKPFQKLPRLQEAPVPPTAASQYHLEGFDWQKVDRVLLLPLRNESAYTRSGEEIQTALTEELRRLGRFEVITATPDHLVRLSSSVHQNSAFDEVVLGEIAKEMRADLVLHGTITQYSPFPQPRLGVVLQALSPEDGRVVASVDGLWDTTDASLAEKIRANYRRPLRLRPRLRNPEVVAAGSFSAELAHDSPATFHRYICNELSRALIGEPETIVPTSGRLRLRFGAGSKLPTESTQLNR